MSNIKYITNYYSLNCNEFLFFFSEIEEKEDKIQQMFKQIEMKNMEVQRYKTAAEVAKVKNYTWLIMYGNLVQTYCIVWIVSPLPKVSPAQK